MIIVMEPGSPQAQIDAVIQRITELGYKAHPIFGVERTVIGCVGHEDKSPLSQLDSMPGVEAAIPILKPYKLAGREFKPAPSVVDVAGVPVGGKQLAIMAGPCSVESRQQVLEVAHAVQARLAPSSCVAGPSNRAPLALRLPGPARPGARIPGYKAREATGLKIVTEIVSIEDLPADGRVRWTCSRSARAIAKTMRCSTRWAAAGCP